MSLGSLFEDEAGDAPFTIMTVCTGNICRSPLAECLLRKVLHGLPVTVHSAGTRALVGRPMTEENCVIAEEFGVEDGAAHRSRQLERADIEEASLIFALSRGHRTAVVELYPRASRYTFTLREFAHLAAAVDLSELDSGPQRSAEQRLRDAVELIAMVRGTIPPLPDDEDYDVIDPYKQSDEVYVRSAREITPAVNTIGTFLRNAVARGVAA